MFSFVGLSNKYESFLVVVCEKSRAVANPRPNFLDIFLLLVEQTSIEGEVGKASGDLAPSSPRSAVASEESTGVRFRGGAIPAKSPEEVLKELQQLWSREREIRERNPERPVVKPPVVPAKPERGGAGFGVRHLFLAMALLSIALVTLLAVFHSSATPPVDAAASQGKQVRSIARSHHLMRFALRAEF